MTKNKCTDASEAANATSWLDKSIKLHKTHMDDPSTATQESQEELNKQIINAQNA